MMRLPAAVQRQIEEGERMFAELQKAQQEAQQEQAATPPVPAEPAPQEAKTEPRPEQLELPLDQPEQPAPPARTDTKSVPPQEPRPEPKRQDEPEQLDLWEQKYRTLQGKYNKEVEEARRQRQQLEQRLQAQETLVQQLAQQRQQALAETPQQKRETRRYLTEDEIREYGPDLVDVIGRRAREVAEEMVGDKLRELDELRTRFQTLDHRVKGLDQDAQSSRKARLESYLDAKVPGWQEQDTDPLFNEWLGQSDGFSGLQRQAILNDAVGKGDLERIARIFLAYRNEQQAITPNGNGAARTQPKAKLDTLVAPGRSRGTPRSEPDAPKPMTEAEINQFAADVTRGRYRGREAEMRAMEERINAALMAGVIQVQPRY